MQVTATLFPVLAASQEIDFSGNISMFLGTALPYTKNSGESVGATTAADFKFKTYTDTSMMFIDTTLTVDFLESQSYLEKTAFVGSGNAFSAKLNEAYIDYNGGVWAVRIGRQASAWGKADGLSVADVLCPQDNTALLADDYSDARLGIDAARFSLNLTSFAMDAYWIPFFTPAALPFADKSPLKKVLFPTSISAGGMTVPIQNFTKDSVTLPEQNLENGEYALKAAAYLPFCDISAYAFYGWDDNPFLTYALTPAGIRIEGSYERMTMLGMDAAIPIKAVTLRLEGAYFPGRYMNVGASQQLLKREAHTVQQDEFTFLAGLDFMPGSWTITAQYYGDMVTGDTDLLERESYNHMATLSISRSFLGDTLTVSANGLVGLRDFDSAVSASVKYNLTDQLTLEAGGNFFNAGPDKDGTYGTYKDLSCVTVKATFSF